MTQHFAPHQSPLVVDEHGLLRFRGAEGALAPTVSGSDERAIVADLHAGSGRVVEPAEEDATKKTRREPPASAVDIDISRAAPATEAPRPYESSSLQELRALCKSHALRVRGTKTELVDRLVEALG